MGKRGKKPRNKRLGPQNPAVRDQYFVEDLFGDDGPAPMTYQGRIITPEVIEQMRADAPEHAHQLDAEWERMVLENNRPWLEDDDRRQDADALWTGVRRIGTDFGGSRP